MTPSPDPDRGFRYPVEVIHHAVWLYHLFRLCLRLVELILAPREVVVSDETVREWGLRFGRLFANELKRRRPRPGDKRYVDEVFIRIRGKLHSPWRAVTSTITCSTSWSRADAVRRGEAREPAGGGASADPLSQHPRRGVTPADTVARRPEAAVQVTASRPTVPLHPLPDPQPLPTPSSPPDR
jgi:hypothetical protein